MFLQEMPHQVVVRPYSRTWSSHFVKSTTGVTKSVTKEFSLNGVRNICDLRQSARLHLIHALCAREAVSLSFEKLNCIKNEEAGHRRQVQKGSW